MPSRYISMHRMTIIDGSMVEEGSSKSRPGVQLLYESYLLVRQHRERHNSVPVRYSVAVAGKHSKEQVNGVIRHIHHFVNALPRLL